MTKKEKALADLHEQMHSENTCTLKEMAINPVFGKGTVDARIVFIGEAPGKKEDESGEPFIGAAGKILSELLASINLTREEIYITNVVKYRPPENRDPLPEEVAACWAWLRKEIELIDPDLVVPLGRHALARFVPDQKISEAHGQVFSCEIEGLTKPQYLALYHPAAAIYNRKLRDTLFDDVKRIREIVR